jgi:hypothetical protein
MVAKVKIELSLYVLTERHSMEAYWGTGSIAPCILELGIKWR